jgi:UDP-N-acetylmuramyl pentapeptide phosphotransferase/UDP-N-acetylglucosamine-1-phosphate transferase
VSSIVIDERRMHDDPKPRIGGIAVYLGFAFALFVADRIRVADVLDASFTIALTKFTTSRDCSSAAR